MSGATYTWTSTNNGNWSDESWNTSWATPEGDTNGPGTGNGFGLDSAIVPDTGASYTLTVNTNVDLNNLYVGTDTSGNTTSDSGDGNVTLQLASGHTVTVAGTLDVEDNITGVGTLVINGAIDTQDSGNGNPSITAGTTLTPGLLDITGSGTIGVTNVPAFFVENGSTLELNVAGGLLSGAQQQFEFNAATGTIYLANLAVESAFSAAVSTSDYFSYNTSVVEDGSISNAGDVIDFANIGTITSASISADGGTVTINGTGINGNTLPYSFLVFDVSNANGSTFNSANDVVDYAPDGNGGYNVWLSEVCFAAGARILTSTGEQMVENLKVGDTVLTMSGDDLVPRPVKWIGRRKLDLTKHPHPERAAPIRIRRGAIANGVPHRDLRVSPDHAIMIDDMLICARQLINGTSIRQESDCKSVEYFHIELETHAILFAEGLATESYLDTGNRGFFANAGAPLVLHPDMSGAADLPAREAGSCLPFVSDEAKVRPIWQRLAMRAAAEGLPTPRLASTTHPTPWIMVQGRALAPVSSREGYYVFSVPAGTTEVRLLSRAARPTDTRPWLEDRRCLGLQVARLSVRSDIELHDIPVDHPSLSSGWWAPERDGTTLRRWTNGDAIIPLPAFGQTTTLEIHADSSTLAYPLEAEETRRAA